MISLILNEMFMSIRFFCKFCCLDGGKRIRHFKWSLKTIAQKAKGQKSPNNRFGWEVNNRREGVVARAPLLKYYIYNFYYFYCLYSPTTADNLSTCSSTKFSVNCPLGERGVECVCVTNCRWAIVNSISMCLSQLSWYWRLLCQRLDRSVLESSLFILNYN